MKNLVTGPEDSALDGPDNEYNEQYYTTYTSPMKMSNILKIL